jgi:peptidoglycan/LPS O-acetylase OafA/YrhL
VSASGAWTRLGLYNSLLFFVLGCLLARAKHFLNPNGSKDLVVAAQNNSRSLIALSLSLVVGLTPLPELVREIGAVILFLIVGLFLNERNAIRKVLNTLGKYSYFIYFAHSFVIGIVFYFITNFSHEFHLKTFLFAGGFLGHTILLLSLITLTAVACIPFAMLSWKLLEAPMIRLGRSKT